MWIRNHQISVLDFLGSQAIITKGSTTKCLNRTYLKSPKVKYIFLFSSTSIYNWGDRKDATLAHNNEFPEIVFYFQNATEKSRFT